MADLDWALLGCSASSWLCHASGSGLLLRCSSWTWPEGTGAAAIWEALLVVMAEHKRTGPTVQQTENLLMLGLLMFHQPEQVP